MTDLDMEREFENINRRLTSIEQILPTLATKQDLERYATKEDLREGIADAKHFTRVLIEAQSETIRIIAEGLVSLTERLERKGVI